MSDKKQYLDFDYHEMDLRNASDVVGGAIDTLLQNKKLEGPGFTSVRDLTDKFRAVNALPLPVEAGVRVRFIANLGSVLSYEDIPEPGMEGTVITVKTSEGNSTFQGDYVCVLWDDGKFRPIRAEHLRRSESSKKIANNVRMVVSDLDDITSMFMQSATGREGELIHKSTKDLWAIRRDGEHYVLERLFDQDGLPLKV